ncbi:MAG: cell cycle RNA binding protein whi3 [Vezdaea aestivalis]|nr:MAG: cell cycle RNA binding protein whi3 [Vezdaea aestivalis]
MAARTVQPSSNPPASINSQHYPAQKSPPIPPSTMQAMNAAIFSPSSLNSNPHMLPPPYGRSASNESAPFSPTASFARESDRTATGPAKNLPAILIRRLPERMTDRELRSMFLMAKNYVDSDFVKNDRAEDKGFATAVTRFRSSSAAQEVKAMLDGKPNSAEEANMIVDFLPSAGTGAYLSRRNTFDAGISRGQSSSTSSSSSSNGPNASQPQRYNGAFMPMDNTSPQNHATGLVEYGNSPGSGDFPMPENSSHFQNLFSPQSPIGNQLNDNSRPSGKSVINSDSVNDDETGELLRDPVAFAENGHSTGPNGVNRRMTNPPLPIARFNNLTLATGNATPSTHSYPSPNRGGPVQTPGPAMSPMHMGAIGPNSSYQLSSQYHQRPNYPPVNPADQNPPCNTLYVGNLPIDTSEDELKAMFSKQRGYKRLCFRTKQQGPMCFVEFEDVSFATKALNELYGFPLHNSVKGGIRLSFSKNPLGVRSGQPSSAPGLPTPTTPHSNMIPGGAIGSGMVSGSGAPPFATAAGPPPGLSAPPGLNSHVGIATVPIVSMPNGVIMPNAYGNGPFAIGGPTPHLGGFRAPIPGPMGGSMLGANGNGAGAPTNGANGGYSDYMMGR